MIRVDRLRLRIEPEGGSDAQANVRLDAFIAALESVQAALVRFDRVATDRGPRGRLTLAYEVVALSLNSPAQVELEPRPVDPTIDTRMKVVGEFLHGVSALEREGMPPPLFDRPMFEAVRDIAEQARRQRLRLTLEGGPYKILFGQNVESKAEAILAEEEGAYGSVEGVLERVNFHRGANVCTIYPEHGPSQVACYFPVHLRDAVNDATLRYVRMTGMVWSDPRSGMPHRVEVDRIEDLERHGPPPTLSELRGIVPDLMNGLPGRDLLERARDGWA